MPKTNKRIKTYRRKLRKTKKNRTRRHYPSYKRSFSAVKARGLTPETTIASAIDNLPCCMCDREFPRKTMFTPLVCLNKNHERAHKICQDCWWDPQIGFAREDAPHGCPGCKRRLPLNPSIKPTEVNEIIVISD